MAALSPRKGGVNLLAIKDNKRRQVAGQPDVNSADWREFVFKGSITGTDVRGRRQTGRFLNLLT
jgi:hypothetical protein